MLSWESYTKNIAFCLRQLSVVDDTGKPIESNQAFTLFRDITLGAREKSKTIFLVGNGASASIASHAAADLAKNAHVRTETFTDLSLMTAIANDISYDQVFSEPVRRRMNTGDMLIAISSSGSSTNILNAAVESLKLGGTIITLSAMSRDNALQSLGLLNFYLPARTSGLAESCHAIILHHWIDLVLEHEQMIEERRSVPSGKIRAVAQL